MMGWLWSAADMVGGVGAVVLAALLFFALIGWLVLPHIREAMWVDSDESQRFQLRIDEVSGIWKVKWQMEDQRLEALVGELEEFCHDAHARGALVDQVFGPDVDAFADDWADAHFSRGGLWSRSSWRGLSVVLFWMAAGGSYRLFDAFRYAETDSSWWLVLAWAIGWGAVAMVALVAADRLDTSTAGSDFPGVLSFVLTVATLLGVLVGTVLLLVRGFEWIGFAVSGLEQSPSKWQALFVVAAGLGGGLWADRRYKNEVSVERPAWAEG